MVVFLGLESGAESTALLPPSELGIPPCHIRIASAFIQKHKVTCLESRYKAVPVFSLLRHIGNAPVHWHEETFSSKLLFPRPNVLVTQCFFTHFRCNCFQKIIEVNNIGDCLPVLHRPCVIKLAIIRSLETHDNGIGTQKVSQPFDFTVFHFKGGPCKPFTKLFVVSITGVIIIANVSVLIISTAQNAVIEIKPM